MKTFRIFFRHGQAHDYEAETCDFAWPRVTLRDGDGNKVVEIRDSDIAAVRQIDGE